MDTHEFLGLPTVLNSDIGLARFVDDLEWEVLHVRLDLSILKTTANETLCVENPKIRLAYKQERGRDSTNVLMGFIAIWFLAASPINLSVSEKLT